MKRTTVFAFLFLLSGALAAQTTPATDNTAYTQAKQEIEATFGTFPSMFAALPEAAVPGLWEYFKATNSPNAAIPPKYRELMQLAVASQIPCAYCVYFHTEAAKAYGATEEEIKEAVLNGASTRNWSMILQGNQIDLAAFKEEFQGMMEHMAKNAKKG